MSPAAMVSLGWDWRAVHWPSQHHLSPWTLSLGVYYAFQQDRWSEYCDEALPSSWQQCEISHPTGLQPITLGLALSLLNSPMLLFCLPVNNSL
jgi:hypothetical protein